MSPFLAFLEADVPPPPATFSPGMKLDALCEWIILGMTGTIGGIGRTAGIVVFVPSELVLFGAVGSMLIFLEGVVVLVPVEFAVELELVEFVLFEVGTTGTIGKTGIVLLVPVELEVEFVVFEAGTTGTIGTTGTVVLDPVELAVEFEIVELVVFDAGTTGVVLFLISGPTGCV